MKAWRFYGFGDMRLDDVPEPVCQPGHVIVEPLCVQPSVTEAQLAVGIPTLAYESIKRRLETEAPVQLFGHEFCARVLKVGMGVTRVRPGDRVAAREAALRGMRVLSRRQGPPLPERADHRLPASRLFRRAGAFARDRAGTCVDDRISDSEAACLQSLSDSVAAVETAGIGIGDSVAIFGQGSMGLECLQIARNSGAGLILTVDVRDEACQVSLDLGAEVALNAADGRSRRHDPGIDRGQRRRHRLRMRGRKPETRAGGDSIAAPGDRLGSIRRQTRRRLLVRGPAGARRGSLARAQPPLPVPRHQHAGASRTHGQTRGLGASPAQADDHPCLWTASKPFPGPSKSPRTRRNIRRSIPPRWSHVPSLD